VKLGLALAGSALGLGGWLGYQLLLQNGRLLLRIEALEQRLAQLADGEALDPLPTALPIGGAAVDFALPDLVGQVRALSSWRGRRVLLILFDPDCEFCRQLLPELADLPLDNRERPLPLVVSSGLLERNRALFGEYGFRGPVLLQEEREIAAVYHLDGTPMGYLIDEQGLIASPPLIGAPALLGLAGGAPVIAGTTSQVGLRRRSAGLITRSLARSRIRRDGLPAGTPAPALDLPLLDGGRFKLDEQRGQPLLLVFSDPACGPCLELAPKLEQLHRRGGEPRLVMIGRGEAAANREQARELGLTFPIPLQRRWEASRAYGLFATPIGYLIDASGTIAAEVAVGADAILALAERAARLNGRVQTPRSFAGT
jgi:peroxiredoxin